MSRSRSSAFTPSSRYGEFSSGAFVERCNRHPTAADLAADTVALRHLRLLRVETIVAVSGSAALRGGWLERLSWPRREARPMAVPVKPRVSQTARASWIGLARARSLYAEFSLGRITGGMCLGGTSALSQRWRWQRANDAAGLADPCGATTPQRNSQQLELPHLWSRRASARPCRSAGARGADPAVKVARAVAAMTGLQLAPSRS